MAILKRGIVKSDERSKNEYWRKKTVFGERGITKIFFLIRLSIFLVKEKLKRYQLKKNYSHV